MRKNRLTMEQVIGFISSPRTGVGKRSALRRVAPKLIGIRRVTPSANAPYRFGKWGQVHLSAVSSNPPVPHKTTPDCDPLPASARRAALTFRRTEAGLNA